MCTYKITVNEEAISMIRPSVTRETFGVLLQRYVDELIEEMTAMSVTYSPNNHTYKEMKSIVGERIRLMEEGSVSYVDGDDGFTMIRERYGL